MILLLKVKQMFLKCFHDNAIKIFSWWPKYCLDLSSWLWTFLCYIRPISFNIYGIKLNDGHFPSRTIIIHFWDKHYQEMNFTCLCSLMQLNWNILREMRNDSRFEHFPWKNVRFCLISIVWVHFIQKTETLILKAIGIL